MFDDLEVDNLTHTLIGIGLAKAGLADRFGPETTVILAVASNLPDIDVACLPFGRLSFLWRRTPTHSVIGMAALALLATWVFHGIYPDLSWPVVFGLTVLGLGLHVFADLWNSYGVVVLWPFRWQRFHLDWVFIIDLALWGILSASWAGAAWCLDYQTVIWRCGLGLTASYIGVCAYARRMAESLLTQQRMEASSAQFILYPEPFGPARFRGVIIHDGTYALYHIWPFKREIRLAEQLPAQDDSSVVTLARQTSAGRRLDWFFITPVWRAAADGQSAIVYGLGFRSNLLKRRSPFTFRITPSGSVSLFRS